MITLSGLVHFAAREQYSRESFCNKIELRQYYPRALICQTPFKFTSFVIKLTLLSSALTWLKVILAHFCVASVLSTFFFLGCKNQSCIVTGSFVEFIVTLAMSCASEHSIEGICALYKCAIDQTINQSVVFRTKGNWVSSRQESSLSA
jgi:hypothetical protein